MVGQARYGRARSGSEGLVRQSRLGPARHVSARLGSAGKVGLGGVRRVWFGWAGEVRSGLARLVGRGGVTYD